ncbi:hypothetical protein CLV63_14116 [Murinocardiopsis flavida]|uniref:Uncharacterized protein n=1 Tax=Murinocardiopsis flavida TaxID=645275 RepID=A0A2P8CDM2_9ACTN|nr:hypothetical protein [Murinocardiopsis flavida]PSK83050.1 hypothetical protein CLV63_14116 [Murinocardiopsis flavida]
MEIIVIAMVIGVVMRDPPGTIRAAAHYKEVGQKDPRGARRRGGLSRYLATVWDAKWDEAAKRYPQKMAAAQKRREARQAKRAAAVDKVKAKWAARKTPEPESGPSPAPAAPAAGAPGGAVIDLDARRKEAEAKGTPPAGTSEPATAPESPAAPTGGAAAPPEKKEQPMALNLSDSASLSSHLAALRDYATYWEGLATSKEQLAAGMRTAGLGEATVAAVDASQQASRDAAAKARLTADALEAANANVAEARASSPEAADGAYYQHQ